jgi:hypothetical protein
VFCAYFLGIYIVFGPQNSLNLPIFWAEEDIMVIFWALSAAICVNFASILLFFASRRQNNVQKSRF